MSGLIKLPDGTEVETQLWRDDVNCTLVSIGGTFYPMGRVCAKYRQNSRENGAITEVGLLRLALDCLAAESL